MSSILKALKKAEEAKTGDLTKQTSGKYAYRVKDKKFWVPILLLIPFSIALFFTVRYFLLYKKSDGSSQITQAVDIIKNDRPAMTSPLPANPSASPSVKGDKGGFENAEGLNSEAIKEIKHKNFLKAESLLERAITIKPDNAELYNNLGLILKARSRYKEAAIQYEKALSLKPDFPEAINNLALANELLGNRQKALELYTKALSLRPAYADAHLNIGLLLESMGKNSEAENHYHTFITLSNDAALKKKVKEKLNSLKN